MNALRSAFLLALLLLTARGGRAESPAAGIPVKAVRTLGVLLFPGFELLDACGPLEIWGNLDGKMKVVTVATRKGEVASVQGQRMVADVSFADCPPLDLLMVPGGAGVLKTLKDQETLAFVKARAASAELTMSVCNGATLLGACGLLDGRPATTNKAYWKLATMAGKEVKWARHARWVDDGNLVTSSGVSAGMDMALHVVERLFGTPEAERVATVIEYEWHQDPAWDPFGDLPEAKKPAAGARPRR